ncbi:Mediator of RNA polymerase II transcription subunit 8, partial [Armadillidium nasatum]
DCSVIYEYFNGYIYLKRFQEEISNHAERVLETALEVIIQRVVDIKSSLQQLIVKVETQGENADWPQYLDSFSVISAQIFSLLKILKNEKTPLLRNYLTLPLQLNADPDEQLLRATEQRVPAFSHDFVPNLLRTKPEPEVEHKLNALETKMTLMNHDTSAREEWETDTASRVNQPQTHSVNETQVLVAALGTGKGIKIIPGRAPPPGPSPGMSHQPPPNLIFHPVMYDLDTYLLIYE